MHMLAILRVLENLFATRAPKRCGGDSKVHQNPKRLSVAPCSTRGLAFSGTFPFDVMPQRLDLPDQ
jgi:hypothetical protein